MSKIKTPSTETGRVGYGSPPVHRRFRKGQSGNPTGKRRSNDVQRVNQIILQEFYRRLTIREGEKTSRKPALQTVLRSLINSALKGNVAAQRTVLKAIQDVEAEAQARRTGGVENRKFSRDANEMTDEELMAIFRQAPNDQAGKED
jgi:Family of unknown function (DUF5681)